MRTPEFHQSRQPKRSRRNGQDPCINDLELKQNRDSLNAISIGDIIRTDHMLGLIVYVDKRINYIDERAAKPLAETYESSMDAFIELFSESHRKAVSFTAQGEEHWLLLTGIDVRKVMPSIIDVAILKAGRLPVTYAFSHPSIWKLYQGIIWYRKLYGINDAEYNSSGRAEEI